MFKLQLVQLGLLLGYQSVISYAVKKISNDDIIDLAVFGPALYGKRDYSLNKVLRNAYNNNKTKFQPGDINPEELGSYVEGDLLIPNYDEEVDRNKLNRNGMTKMSSIWPGGFVPYVFDGHFQRSEIRAILNAFDNFAAKTCIKFYPRKTERDYLAFQNTRSGCFSAVGRIGGKQIINLAGPYCLRLGTVCHEIMHALGFFHEHTRYDRDDYVKVLYKNVKANAFLDFKSTFVNNSNNYGVPYDYASILHYSSHAGTKNNGPTIKALTALPNGIKMGQRVDFSPLDLAKIRARYRCGYVHSKDNEKEEEKNGLKPQENFVSKFFKYLN